MTFFSALILGLLASAHCAGMCGGLQSVLQQPSVMRSHLDASKHLIALNMGRIFTYVTAGFVFSTVGSTIVLVIDVPRVTEFTRLFTAVVLVALGVQMLLSRAKPFTAIERLGANLWNLLSRRLKASDNSKINYSFYRGIIWGFLPCGLIYGVLITTLFLADSIDGALVMLGFGLGTLPAMILTGGLYQTLRALVRNRAVQTVGGLIFIQGGIMVGLAPQLVNTEFMNAYPQLAANMFCIT